MKIYISPDDDQLNLENRGGDGIGRELVLGDNVYGTGKLIVKPGQKLIRVTSGRHQSYHTATQHATMELAVRLGANDVGDQQPALFPDGTRRPAMLLEPIAECKPFVDNFIFVDAFNNQERMIQFFKCLGKTKEGNPPPTKRISVRAAGKAKGKQQWKVAAADVMIEDIDFILQVYHFAKKVWDGEDATLAEWLLDDRHRLHKERMEVEIEDIARAVRIAHNEDFHIVDTDLTIDTSGTLHAQDLIKALKRAGYTIIESTKCGLQCIKCIPPGHQGVIIKFYNKIIETVQQGAARKSNVDCKVSKLLSPSTAGLNEKTLDEKYNLNGITRLEITFPFYTTIDKTIQLDMTWKYKQMYKLLGDAHKLLTDCLVSASIHDHLAGMEPFIKRSIVTYFPPTYDYKRRELFQTKNKKKDGDEWKKKWPDAYVCRHSNRYTSKMNGIEVHALLDSRTPNVNGWDPTALVAAACSITGEPPTLLVCVGGLEKFFGVQDSIKNPLIRNLYFVAVPLIRTPVFPRLRLQTYFIGAIKNDWEAINVRPDDLLLNPAVTTVLRKSEVMTEVSIPAEFSPDDLPPINDFCSDTVELFTGLAKGIKAAHEDNMPTEPSKWSDIKIGLVGRYKKEKLKFKYKGQWFWLPPAWEAEIRKHVFGKTNVDCTFRWGPSGFVCSIDHTTDADPASTSEDDMSDSPPCSAATLKTIHVGNVSGAGDIPPSIDGHEIETGGFMQRKGKQPSCYLSLRGNCERFWITKSLSERLFADAKAECAQSSIDPIGYSLDYLAGCRLVKPDNDKIGVTGYSNPEYRMRIVKASGDVLMEQPETSRSTGKRKASHGGVDVGGSSQRQRT
jgi:hypothetical protein